MNLRSHGPEPCASANSAISAYCLINFTRLRLTEADLINSCSAVPKYFIINTAVCQAFFLKSLESFIYTVTPLINKWMYYVLEIKYTGIFSGIMV